MADFAITMPTDMGLDKGAIIALAMTLFRTMPRFPENAREALVQATLMEIEQVAVAEISKECQGVADDLDIEYGTREDSALFTPVEWDKQYVIELRKALAWIPENGFMDRKFFDDTIGCIDGATMSISEVSSSIARHFQMCFKPDADSQGKFLSAFGIVKADIDTLCGPMPLPSAPAEPMKLGLDHVHPAPVDDTLPPKPLAAQPAPPPPAAAPQATPKLPGTTAPPPDAIELAKMYRAFHDALDVDLGALIKDLGMSMSTWKNYVHARTAPKQLKVRPAKLMLAQIDRRMADFTIAAEILRRITGDE